MSTHQHPYDVGGTARAWFIAALAVRLASLLVIGSLAYVIIPALPLSPSRQELTDFGHEVDESIVYQMIVAALVLIAYFGFQWLARYCDRQALGDVPGAFGWRNSIRDPGVQPGGVIHLRTHVIWLVVRTLADLGISLAILSKGMTGAVVIVYVFAGVATIALWRRASDAGSSIASCGGWAPAGIIASIELLGQSYAPILIGLPAVIGCAIGLGIAARSASHVATDREEAASHEESDALFHTA